MKLEVSQFVGSVALLGWAKEHGCPWTEHTLALPWDCSCDSPWDSPWNATISAFAAYGVGAAARLPLEQEQLCRRRSRRARRRAEVGAGARLPVG